VKVGDLVKDKRSIRRGVVLKIKNKRFTVPHILILDTESSIYWEWMSEYEVISESR
jgi:hypothetical protein